MSINQSMENKNRRTHRNFLSEKDKKNIMDMYKSEHLSFKEISSKLSISTRQVSEFLRQVKKGQTNTFTDNDDNLIVEMYNSGVVKESLIAKVVVTKAPWMIRNRIKYLKKIKRIPKEEEEIVIEQDEPRDITIIEVPIAEYSEENSANSDSFDNQFEIF